MSEGSGRCPTCGGLAAPRAQRSPFPFCSPRCRQIDLGRWFEGSYRIPVVGLGSPGEGTPGEESEET